MRRETLPSTFHTPLRDGGDAAAAARGVCFPTRVLLGLTFPIISLVFQLTRISGSERCPSALGHLQGHHQSGWLSRYALDRISWPWAHCSDNSFVEMENCGEKVGTCPQDACPGLLHLLRLKEGMHLDAKQAHRLFLGFYSFPELPLIEKKPCEDSTDNPCVQSSISGRKRQSHTSAENLRARMEQDNC